MQPLIYFCVLIKKSKHWGDSVFLKMGVFFSLTRHNPKNNFLFRTNV